MKTYRVLAMLLGTGILSSTTTWGDEPFKISHFEKNAKETGLSDLDIQKLRAASSNFSVTNISKAEVYVASNGQSSQSIFAEKDNEKAKDGQNGDDLTIVGFHVEDGTQLLFFKGSDFSKPVEDTFLSGNKKILLSANGGSGGDVYAELTDVGYFTPATWTEHESSKPGNAGNIRIVALDSLALKSLRDMTVESTVFSTSESRKAADMVISAEGGKGGDVVRLGRGVHKFGDLGKGGDFALVDASEIAPEVRDVSKADKNSEH
jgi:hypothetical protein